MLIEQFYTVVYIILFCGLGLTVVNILVVRIHNYGNTILRMGSVSNHMKEEDCACLHFICNDDQYIFVTKLHYNDVTTIDQLSSGTSKILVN